MKETFYRLHHDKIPFTPDRAWSGRWGAEFNENGSRTRCFTCDGTGIGVRDCPRCTGPYAYPEDRWACPTCDGEGVVDGCGDCDGEGWEDCVRGFSCERSPAALLRYFQQRGMGGVNDTPDGRVIVFEGRQTGVGFDGEPCAVPEAVLEEMTWDEFVARYGEGE